MVRSRGKWRPCAACMLSVQRDADVRDSKLTIAQFVDELRGRLIRDREYVDISPLLQHRRTEIRYHCLACKMIWGILTIDDIGTAVYWHPLPASD